MKQFKYLGVDRSGPVGMTGNPYSTGSLEWNAVVDFACMPDRVFTLEESAKYHGVEVEYYTPETIMALIRDGIIEENEK